jgi:hypothetical protein
MSESQTHTSGNSETGASADSGSLAGTVTETPSTDGAAAAHEAATGEKGPTVTSAAEQETADATRLDRAVNGDQAGDHAADGQPTQADKAAQQ